MRFETPAGTCKKSCSPTFRKATVNRLTFTSEVDGNVTRIVVEDPAAGLGKSTGGIPAGKVAVGVKVTVAVQVAVAVGVDVQGVQLTIQGV